MFFTDLIIVSLKCGFELNFCGWKNDSFTRMKYISSNNTLIPSPGDSYGGTLLSLQIYYKIICRVGVANNENLISFKSYFCWKRVRWNMKKFVIILQKVIDLDTQTVYTNYGNFFAEYFIHLSNDVNDSTATITKQNVHGTSFDQYLSFSYYVTGMGSNITVSVNGSISGLLWNFNSTSLSIWGSATINISTLGVYQVLS